MTKLLNAYLLIDNGLLISGQILSYPTYSNGKKRLLSPLFRISLRLAAQGRNQQRTPPLR